VLRVHSVGQTDPGRQRSQNEDSILVAPEIGLFVVCDGMGGHASGAVASQLAVATIAEVMRTGNPPPPPGVDAIVAAIQAANGTIYAQSMSNPACRGMGTTVVAVHAERDVLHLCHVGDSRIYRVRGGHLDQVTRDHSLVNLYEDRPDLRGTLGPPKTNVIVRALGLKPQVEVDQKVVAMEDGDLYLLCSDGLVDMVQDWILQEMLTSGDPIEQSCDALIRMANANGGADNVSVVLVQVYDR
jgi:serine/threonine protein phosphatase PrpC